jgi:hypothetical protein
MTDSVSPDERSQFQTDLEKDGKRVEFLVKHYQDLFSYHASQRLTTFNFFLLSLSFICNAYATLITKADPTSSSSSNMASMLALAAYLLIVAFNRLDARNEQIIWINESALKRIQKEITARHGGSEWETFQKSDDQKRFAGTFGQLLPFIYIVASILAAFGMYYGFFQGALTSCQGLLCLGALILISIGSSIQVRWGSRSR